MFRTNKNTPLIAHTQIVEWDMKSANTSIMREYKLAPTKWIARVEAMDGDNRKKQVGLRQQKVKGLAKAMEEGFNEIVQKFIETNGLEENDIISIKRDAVFIRSRIPQVTTIGQYCHFRPKGTYVAFLILNGYEFYMKQDGQFDIKGISDELIPLHNDGILQFIRDFLDDFDYDMNGLHQYCKDFVNAYKKRELPLDYYRSLNGESTFTLITESGAYNSQFITESMIDDVDISYNYENIVLPLIQYLF